MADFEPRRSSRLNTHDPNGRDYLCSLMGWSRYRLESWITSPTVQPHLQLWYRLCIESERRYNDAAEWINTGSRGYYYRESDLEDDLLLMCLCEGNGGDGDTEPSAYASGTTNTGKWITQELWARTAWRIVQANRGEGQAFTKMSDEHPAACYGFAVDLLSIAFHSIAHRREASCYEELINGPAKSVHQCNKVSGAFHEALNDDGTESVTNCSTVSSSTETSDNSADLDFEVASSRTSSPGKTGPIIKREMEKKELNASGIEEWVEFQQRRRMGSEDTLNNDMVGHDVRSNGLLGFAPQCRDLSSLKTAGGPRLLTIGYDGADGSQEDKDAVLGEEDTIIVKTW